MDESNSIKLNAEFGQLCEECRVLKDELAELFVELEHINKSIIPNMIADYAVKVGIYQYELLQLQIEFRRTKREIELIQAAINRNEIIKLHDVQKQLEDEFLEWKTKLDSQLKDINDAKMRLSSLMSAQESAELRKMYRILAKKLHPDVNPDQTQEARNLWLQVQYAYEIGDLAQLRALFLMAEDIPENYDLPNSIEILKKRRADFKEQITNVLQKLADVRKHPIFEMECLLLDPIKTGEMQNNIKNQIEETKELLKSAKLMLIQMRAAYIE